MQRFLGHLALLITATVFAACGRPPSEQSATAPTVQVVVPAATAAPAATVAPPTAAPTQPAATTPVAPPTAAATALSTTVDGIPFSRTPEGYHVLGDPNAPVTLTMYSDFL